MPDDHDLYLAGFGDDGHQCLRLLLDHATDVREIARMALAAPISTNDTEGVRLLLAAGADPRKYVHDDDSGAESCPVAHAAVRAGCAAELMQLLLAHGAEPDATGPDGLSPDALAIALGRADLAALLRRHGASDDAADTDRLLAACLRADRGEAQRLLARRPSLADRLPAAQKATAMAQAAQAGHTAAVGLMLDLGFPIEARDGQDGRTALHAAAFSGSASTVALLAGRGADLEARDATYDSTPLDWAVVGSGYQPADNPGPDWVATVRILIEAGASTAVITLSPDDPKPPSPDVADLLRGYGVGAEDPGK